MLSKVIRYGVAGGTAFICDVLLVYLMFTYTTWHYSIVIILTFTWGSLVNYTINRLWGFKESNRNLIHGYIYFLCIAIVGIGLTILCMMLMMKYMHIDKLVARIFAAVFVFAWSFFANYFLNFK